MQVETVPSTSVTLSELLPGETHTFRVMAGNIAGLSTPSVTVTHTPAPRGECVWIVCRSIDSTQFCVG